MSMAETTTIPLFWRGPLAVVTGIVSLACPAVALGAFVVVFAVHALVAAGIDVMRAFISGRVGPVAGYLLLAALSLAAAFGSLTWPGVTALVLTVCVAVWALVTGVVEVPCRSGTARALGSGRCGCSAVWCRSSSGSCSPRGPAPAQSRSRPCSASSPSCTGLSYS
jgi:uncharacterized membrane protein HdeD (DUF308 family)